MKIADRTFRIRAKSDLALFTRPETRSERHSYQIPTYDAVRGLFSSIYWKPTFNWVPERVLIMAPIHMRTISLNHRKISELSFKSIVQTLQTYLTDVDYVIEARFEWEDQRPDLIDDRNQQKHEACFLRALERGGRFPTTLGTSECVASVEPCSDYEAPEQISLDIGPMWHGWDYAGQDRVGRRMWLDAKVVNGAVEFPGTDAPNVIKRSV